ncbi:MAG: pyridoxamine 5'-phosphate oxidase family protein [Thermodesulfobacteriota bacterium]
MRHPERELQDQKTMVSLLKDTSIGRMATVNRKGIPVIKPVNYLYWNGKIYIHSSRKGEKVNDIQRGSPVCFEIDQPISYVHSKGSGCKANYYYRSVIIKGKANFVKERAKKNRILQMLIGKYQPEGEDKEIPEEILKKTAVIEILPQEITGKENL